MGKEGIIAEHPTLRVKYLDPEMERISLELKERLEAEREEEYKRRHVGEAHLDRESNDANTSTGDVTTDPASGQSEPQ